MYLPAPDLLYRHVDTRRTNGAEPGAGKHGIGVSQRDSIIISISDNGESEPVSIYLADGKVGEPLKGANEDQEAAIRQAIEEGMGEGKRSVLIKAEQGVLHRDVSRIAAAAGGVSEEVTLNLAVMEAE